MTIPRPLGELTANDLLEAIKTRTEEDTKDLIMPTRVQTKGEEQEYRAATVYKMRLPDSKSATKKTPYVLLQIIKTEDERRPGQPPDSRAYVRIICAVYNEDEQEGALMLLNLMERLRISWQKNPLFGERGQFLLEVNDEKLEGLIYPDDTAPYYGGELYGIWHLPPVKREVLQVW